MRIHTRSENYLTAMLAAGAESSTYRKVADIKFPIHGKFVVKRTFLELDTDSTEESIRLARASSDPGPLNIYDNSSDGELGDSKTRCASGVPEKCALPDFADSDGDYFESDDEESTAVPSYSPMTSHGVSSFGSMGGMSSWDSAAFGRILDDEQDTEFKIRADPASFREIQSLANENSRLTAENEMLRQHCLEVAKAAHNVAAATASAAAACWVDAKIPKDQQVDNLALPISSSSPTYGASARGSSLASLAGAPSQQRSSSSFPMAGKSVTPFGKSTGQWLADAQSLQYTSRQQGRCTGDRWGASASKVDECLESSPCTLPVDERTTVMLRNIPNNYTRQFFIELLDAEGFACQYDFIYLPTDFKSRANLGYAFVNLTFPAAAQRFMKTFNGFSNWILPSKKVCSVSWSGPHQGLQAHLERYRNSTVMHQAVPDAYKPVVFQDGVRVPFPAPTKRLREPRIRPSHPGSMHCEYLEDTQSAASGSYHLSQQVIAEVRNDEQWWLLLQSGA